MNWLSCEEPKNSFIAAVTGFAFIRSCGMMFSRSWRLMRSLMVRSIRTRPMRNWFSSSSPTLLTRRLPRWSMSSTSPLPVLRSIRYLMVSRMSSFVSTLFSMSTSRPSFLFIFSLPTGERS